MPGTRLVNRTIDDDLGDSITGVRPTYSPADGWIRNGSPAGVSLDTSRISNGTWHQAAGSGERSISVTFTGVAVSVNLIIVRSMPPTLQETNLTFTLDPSAGPDAEKTLDLQLPNLGTGGPLYNWQAYGVSGLPFRPHTLLITTSGATNSLFLFDSVRYVEESDLPESAATRPSLTASSTQTSVSKSTSTPNTSMSSLQNSIDPTITSTISSHNRSTSTSVGPIVGGVVGVVLAAAILIAVVLFRCRRKRRSSKIKEDIEPFHTGGENRNRPSAPPVPVRYVNPSEPPFAETKASTANATAQRIISGSRRNAFSSHARPLPNAPLGQSGMLNSPAHGMQQSRASIVVLSELVRHTAGGTLTDVERIAHPQSASNGAAEHVGILSARNEYGTISGSESARAQDGSVLPSAEPHTQTSREDPPKPRAHRQRKSLNDALSDSLPRNAIRPIGTTLHDQESPPPFASPDTELPHERERLLHLALPWSLGQRILALMGTGIARTEGGTEGDGQDAEPPPAYEPRHLNTYR